MRSEVLVRELRANYVVFFLQVFDPSFALSLRIDHQRRSQSSCCQNAVLHGQLVVW